MAIGGYVNGQDSVNSPATEETTVSFGRLLNIINANAPGPKIILVCGPDDILPAIERVLAKTRRLAETLIACRTDAAERVGDDLRGTGLVPDLNPGSLGFPDWGFGSRDGLPHATDRHPPERLPG